MWMTPNKVLAIHPHTKPRRNATKINGIIAKSTTNGNDSFGMKDKTTETTTAPSTSSKILTAFEFILISLNSIISYS